MKLNYRFSNLCGTAYKRGSLLFTPDGNSLISPVGNRVTVYNLVGNRSQTLPFEARSDIRCLALSPNSLFLLVIDVDGYGILVNFFRNTVLAHFNFKEKVHHASFSPDGSFFAIGVGRRLQVWRTPGLTKEFAPFVLFRTYKLQFAPVSRVDWSPDGSLLLAGCADGSAHLYTLNPKRGFRPFSFTGHRQGIRGCYFDSTGTKIYTVSKDGAVFVWRQADVHDAHIPLSDEGLLAEEDRRVTGEGQHQWELYAKHYFMENGATVSSCGFCRDKSLLVVGHTNGVVSLAELPDFVRLQDLSISTHRVHAACVNSTGEWVAFGCAHLGQLLVWEWASETYVMKQQGHLYDINCLAYSPGGDLVVTGGEDGKVKVWNMTTGFCFVTFSQHKARVQGVCFLPNGKGVVSASADGTVRAFDLGRYRCFRTMKPSVPAQLSCVAVDPSGEVVVAGASDSFDIIAWNLQTGKQVDTLAGHEGPVTAVSFSPTSAVLYSGSWDKTMRIWDVFAAKGEIESVPCNSDVLDVSVRSDGRQAAACALNGDITLWDVAEGTICGVIEGKRDVAGGRSTEGLSTAKSDASNKHYTSLCYSPDGSSLVAGGNSKWVCMYDVESRLLRKRFQISRNRSIDAVLDKLNSKRITQAGSLSDVEMSGSSGDEARPGLSMPGVRRTDLSKRKKRITARTQCVRFSATGDAFAAASMEGLLVYSLDSGIVFDPSDLDVDVTPARVAQLLAAEEWSRALVIALKLGENKYLDTAFHSVPSARIDVVVGSLPDRHLERFVSFLVTRLAKSTRLEFCLLWTASLLRLRGEALTRQFTTIRAADTGQNARNVVFVKMLKALQSSSQSIGKIASSNTHILEYLISAASQKSKISEVLSEGQDGINEVT